MKRVARLRHAKHVTNHVERVIVRANVIDRHANTVKDRVAKNRAVNDHRVMIAEVKLWQSSQPLK